MSIVCVFIVWRVEVLLLTMWFLKSICSVLLLLREGGRKLWKGFNLLRGGSCAVNTPVTSSLGWCQGFFQPWLYKGGGGGGRDPHRCFLLVPSTSLPDAKRINSGRFRTTTRLCPKLEPVILFTEWVWCMMPVSVLSQQYLKLQDDKTQNKRIE